MRRFQPLAFVVLSLVALAASAGKKTPLQPGKYKDWGPDIDKIEIVQTFSLNNYHRVVVEDLDTKDVPLPDRDDNTYHAVKEILANADDPFGGGVAGGLEDTGIKVTSKLRSESTPALIIRGKVTQMDPGSQSARYWVGFGAGAARATVEIEVVDAQTKQVLLRITQERRSGVGRAGGDYDEVMERNLIAVGNDIGAALMEFYSEKR